MLIKSTFKYSNALEALVDLNNKIDNGELQWMPIEQRIGALYSGNVLADSLMKQDDGYFTEDEIYFIIGAYNSIHDEINQITTGHSEDWGQ